MLKRLDPRTQAPDASGAAVAMRDAAFPAPFASGLEYAAPARGGWNIVHVGMLIPEAHEIFVCAAGCLRGVVLTAAEMGAQERFSTIEVRENNVLEGDMEELILDGVGDILARLKRRPPAVLLYTSCVHHFMGVDLGRVYRELRLRYPDVDFTDCYMNPIMRKSGLTPDQLMRRQLYSLLKPCEQDGGVSIIGNDFPLDEDSLIKRMVRASGRELREITSCRTYAEYQRMAASSICISTQAPARAGGDELERRLGQRHLYLPQSFDADTLERNARALAEALGTPLPDLAAERERAAQALEAARERIGSAPVAIDYTFTSRPLELARLLIEQGFNVTDVYLDSISAEERAAFVFLKVNAPDLMLRATINPKMRVLPRERGERTLALGQKAAYFTGTDYFVNAVEDGGMYGLAGAARLAQLMLEAWAEPKSARALIQVKGLGCGCCL